MEDRTSHPSDPLLLPYLQADEEAAAQRYLERLLVHHALPILRAIQSDKFREAHGENHAFQAQEAREFLDEAVSRIAQALARRRQDSTCAPISDFAAYVAASGYHEFSEYLRKKYPARANLANQVNLELDRAPALARWKFAVNAQRDAWHGGLKRWRNENRAPVVTAALRAFLTDPRVWGRDDLPDDPRTGNLATQLETIFRAVQTPVLVTRLVTALVLLREIKEQTLVTASDVGDDPVRKALDRVAVDTHAGNARHDPAARAEHLETLRRAWAKIREFPRHQQIALLLHARDDQGGAVIHQLTDLGIASARDMAASMGVPVETVEDLWNRLPLEDKDITPLIPEATSRQIGSLRECARRRLNRNIPDA